MSINEGPTTVTRQSTRSTTTLFWFGFNGGKSLSLLRKSDTMECGGKVQIYSKPHFDRDIRGERRLFYLEEVPIYNTNRNIRVTFMMI